MGTALNHWSAAFLDKGHLELDPARLVLSKSARPEPAVLQCRTGDKSEVSRIRLW